MNTKAFKHLLIDKGISQNKLAKHLNITARTMCYKVSGKRAFTVTEALILCDVLGIPDNEIRKYFG